MRELITIGKADAKALLKYTRDVMNIDVPGGSENDKDALKTLLYDAGLSAGTKIPVLPDAPSARPAGVVNADTVLRNEDRRCDPTNERWVAVKPLPDMERPAEGLEIVQTPVPVILNGDFAYLERDKTSWIPESKYWVLHDAVRIEWSGHDAKLSGKIDAAIDDPLGTPIPVHNHPVQVMGVGGRVVDGDPPAKPGEDIKRPNSGMHRSYTPEVLEPIMATG